MSIDDLNKIRQLEKEYAELEKQYDEIGWHMDGVRREILRIKEDSKKKDEPDLFQFVTRKIRRELIKKN